LFPFVDRESNRLRTVWKVEVGENAIAVKKRMKGALICSQELSDKRSEAHALYCLGWGFYRLGDLNKSSEHLLRAKQLLQTSPSADEQGEVLFGLGSLYVNLGDMQRALESYQDSLSLWQTVNDPWWQGKLLVAMARLYTMSGDHQRALEGNRKVLALSRQTGDRVGEGAALNNIGYANESLGNLELARDYFRQALAIFEDLKIPQAEILTLQYIGQASYLLGELEEAQKSYEESLARLKQARDHSPFTEADLHNYLGVLYLSQNRKEDSLRSFQQALSIFEKGENVRGLAYTLNNIGYYYWRLGEKQKALDHYLRALTLMRAFQDHQGEVLTLYYVARIETDLGNLASARSRIEESIGTIESSRTKVASHDLLSSYAASIHQHYELYINILMQLHKLHPGENLDAIALEASERGRARSLLETINESRADIRQGVDPELLRRERALQAQFDAKAAAQIKLLGGKHEKKDADRLDQEIRKLTREYQELEDEIRTNGPGYAELTRPSPLRAPEIRELLDPDTVLLEYSLGDERSFVWAITQDSVNGFELPAREEIEAAAHRISTALTERNREESNETLPRRKVRLENAEIDYATAAARLAHLVLDPVVPVLGRKRLVVIPDGALQLVPFAALPAPAKNTPSSFNARLPTAPRLLMEDHEIINLPSASVLAVQRRTLANRSPAPHAVAVLANPVFDREDERVKEALSAKAKNPAAEPVQPGGQAPLSSAANSKQTSELTRALRDVGLKRIAPLYFSQEEAESIIGLVPKGEGLAALNFRASRALATSPELSKYRVIHFATHGVLDLEHPELSGILLSMVDENGQPQDGYLRLYQIYNLNLPADLVVLSACQTAIGKQVKGEGLMALTRGFMYAGATRVVASLWKVDDAATAELMKEFYKQMFTAGLKPAAALREAQIKMSQQKRWRSPYYWAGFVLQGEWK